MQRDSMVFYRSFHEATKELPPEIYKEAMVALMDYALDGKLNEVSAFANMFLQMAKPQIDANNQRYINGSKGGRKSEPKTVVAEKEETKQEPNKNRIVTTPEPNVNVNDNENVNVNKKKHSCTAEADALFERLWKEYPVKKGKGQVSATQKKKLLAVGETALFKAIERYRAELAKDSGWRRAQNGSTFFNSGYIDYLDENYVPSQEKAPENRRAGTPNRFHNFVEREGVDYDAMMEAETLKWLEGIQQ
ncbi:DUF6291 domain-containing protein [Brotaphodocola sp.]|uniref:DUF6291 domain-containing protein n=1 Tax=Brotaphodocola sp. TaxID=3073577 RepID=UPI003D7CC37E